MTDPMDVIAASLTDVYLSVRATLEPRKRIASTPLLKRGRMRRSAPEESIIPKAYSGIEVIILWPQR